MREKRLGVLCSADVCSHVYTAVIAIIIIVNFLVMVIIGLIICMYST